MTTSADTPTSINLVRATVVLHGIRFYLATGTQVNRMFTPTNLRKVASQYTGNAYPASRKGLQRAHDELAELLDKVKEVLAK